MGRRALPTRHADPSLRRSADPPTRSAPALRRYAENMAFAFSVGEDDGLKHL